AKLGRLAQRQSTPYTCVGTHVRSVQRPPLPSKFAWEYRLGLSFLRNLALLRGTKLVSSLTWGRSRGAPVSQILTVEASRPSMCSHPWKHWSAYDGGRNQVPLAPARRWPASSDRAHFGCAHGRPTGRSHRGHRLFTGAEISKVRHTSGECNEASRHSVGREDRTPGSRAFAGRSGRGGRGAASRADAGPYG